MASGMASSSVGEYLPSEKADPSAPEAVEASESRVDPSEAKVEQLEEAEDLLSNDTNVRFDLLYSRKHSTEKVLAAFRGENESTSVESREFISSIWKEDWPAVLSHIKERPKLVGVSDFFGMFPIHWAAQRSAPPEVIKTFLKRFPSAAQEQDCWERLPIHYAAKFKASYATTRAILSAFPKGLRTKDKQGLLPLHHASKAPSAMEFQNDLEDVIVSKEGSIDRIEAAALAKGAGLSVKALEKDKLNPSRFSLQAYKLLLSAYPEAADEGTHFASEKALHLAIKSRYWRAIPFLLEVNRPAAEIPIDDRYPLHLACEMRGPLPIMQRLYAAYPAAIVKPTDSGLLPLHIAVECMCSVEVIKLLLEMNPKSIRNPDRLGQLPLHLALQSAVMHAYSEKRDEESKLNGEPSHDNPPENIGAESEVSQDTIKKPKGLSEIILASDLPPDPDEVVLLLIERFPESTKVCDSQGQLPLNHSLVSSFSNKVIQVLARTNPSASSTRDLSSHLPLDICLRRQLSDDIVLTIIANLLEQFPERDSRRKLSDFEFPVREALERGYRGKVIEELLEMFPLDASIDLDENGTKLFDFVIGMTPAVPLSTIALVVAADMPITRAYPDSPSVRKPHNGHARTWLRVLRDFDDSYLKVVEMILDWGWFDKYVLVNVVDEEGRRVIDSATPGCRKTVMERMYFAGRYDVLNYDHVHEGEESLVIFAIDEPQERQPVALRLTKNGESFAQELNLRDLVKLDANFVVPLTNVLDATADQDFAKELVLKRLEEYKYCYATPRASRNLHHALVHARIPGNIEKSRQILKQVTEAVDHLHSMDVLHTDLTPFCVMEIDGKWKISGLEAAVRSADKGKAGKKLHSGYIAPELVHIDLSEKAACPKKIQGASQRGYSPVSASVKQDLWALGAIAFEVLTGYSLWQADHHGMCNESELFRLAEWSPETKAARLNLIKDKVALDFVSNLLEKNPEDRPDSLQRVLAHPFFSRIEGFRLKTMSPQYDIFLSLQVPKRRKYGDEGDDGDDDDEDSDYDSEDDEGDEDGEDRQAQAYQQFFEDICSNLAFRGLKVWRCDPTEKYEEGFMSGLMDSKVFVPIIMEASLSPLSKIKEHSRAPQLAVELRLARELQALGFLKSTIPLLVGNKDPSSKNYMAKFEWNKMPPPQTIVVESVEASVKSKLEKASLGTPVLGRQTLSTSVNQAKQLSHVAAEGQYAAAVERACFAIAHAFHTVGGPVPRALELKAIQLSTDEEKTAPSAATEGQPLPVDSTSSEVKSLENKKQPEVIESKPSETETSVHSAREQLRTLSALDKLRSKAGEGLNSVWQRAEWKRADVMLKIFGDSKASNFTFKRELKVYTHIGPCTNLLPLLGLVSSKECLVFPSCHAMDTVDAVETLAKWCPDPKPRLQRRLSTILLTSVENRKPSGIFLAQLRVARSVAICLASLHSRNLVHRDVCVRNVFIDARGNTYLGGLSLAVSLSKVLASNKELERVSVFVKQSKLRFGSVYHCPPETLKNGSVYFSSDIYSYGMFLYEMFGKTRPFALPSDFVDIPDSNDPEPEMIYSIALGDRRRRAKGEATPHFSPVTVAQTEQLSQWSQLSPLELRRFRVKNNPQMPLPASWPQKLRELIISCWKTEPANRPSLDSIITVLNSIIADSHPCYPEALAGSRVISEESSFESSFPPSQATPSSIPQWGGMPQVELQDYMKGSSDDEDQGQVSGEEGQADYGGTFGISAITDLEHRLRLTQQQLEDEKARVLRREREVEKLKAQTRRFNVELKSSQAQIVKLEADKEMAEASKSIKSARTLNFEASSSQLRGLTGMRNELESLKRQMQLEMNQIAHERGVALEEVQRLRSLLPSAVHHVRMYPKAQASVSAKKRPSRSPRKSPSVSEFRRRIQEAVPVHAALTPKGRTWAGWEQPASGDTGPKELKSQKPLRLSNGVSPNPASLAPPVFPAATVQKDSSVEHVRVVTPPGAPFRNMRELDEMKSAAGTRDSDASGRTGKKWSPRNVGDVMIYSEKLTARVPLLFSSVHQDSGRLR